MTRIKVSDFIIRFIAAQGVKHVFLISGGGNMHLVDSASKSKELRYICNHHEQACAMAAEAYGRVGENIGVCITTVGPAATNTLTGVAGAWLDSIPALYICGQVKRDNMITGTKLRQLGVQEINIVDIAKPMTKYSEVVMDPSDIQYHLQKAVFLAKAGRPGPVLLDIPSDVQAVEVEESSLREFDPEAEGLFAKPSHALAEQIKELLNLFKTAKRPIIFAGHGIALSGARKEFLELIDRLQIPVTTTMSAHDLVPADHPLYAGRPGVFGDRNGNLAIQNSDLLLSIGARHHLWNIGYTYKAFARGAKKVIVDIDQEELKKKTVVPDIAIASDAKVFINALLESVGQEPMIDVSGWMEKCKQWKLGYPIVTDECKNQKDSVNSYYFTEVLSDFLKAGDTVVTGVGTSFTGTLQSIRLKQGVRLHCNVGCASMGWDLPAAIGACFAKDKQPVILLTGEGSIMMNIQELQTISYYGLPIKIFLFNNNGYLAIKNTQNSFFAGNLAAVDEHTGLSFPDFKKVADTFGISYEQLLTHDGMASKIEQVLAYQGPILCDVRMSPTQPLLPKVYSEKLPDGTMISKPLEDMYPFLDREEFKNNMFIEEWRE